MFNRDLNSPMPVALSGVYTKSNGSDFEMDLTSFKVQKYTCFILAIFLFYTGIKIEKKKLFNVQTMKIYHRKK